MSISRGNKKFGPLLYGVLVLASMVLIGLYSWELWPSWRQEWELRTLAGELRSPSSLVSRHAADELARAGAPGISWLVAAAKDRDGGVRLLAFTALGRTAPVPGPTIPTLADGLRDPDARIRCEAADALARLGPEAVAAVDALKQTVRDDNPDVRFRAARALAAVDGKASEPALAVLMALIADPEIAHIPDRTVLVPVIRRMGPSAESRAVAALIPRVDARDPSIRRTAIECLERLGPPARDAISALKEALQDEDQVARCLAALALSEIEGWGSGHARSMLQSLAESPALPARMRKPVQWVLTANLVAGSEVSQPVHTLRNVVAEFRLDEARKKTEAARSVEVEEVLPTP